MAYSEDELRTTACDDDRNRIQIAVCAIQVLVNPSYSKRTRSFGSAPTDEENSKLHSLALAPQ